MTPIVPTVAKATKLTVVMINKRKTMLMRESMIKILELDRAASQMPTDCLSTQKRTLDCCFEGAMTRSLVEQVPLRIKAEPPAHENDAPGCLFNIEVGKNTVFKDEAAAVWPRRSTVGRYRCALHASLLMPAGGTANFAGSKRRSLRRAAQLQGRFGSYRRRPWFGLDRLETTGLDPLRLHACRHFHRTGLVQRSRRS